MQKRHMIIAGVLAVILLLGWLGVKLAGQRAIEYVHRMAEEQTALKGKLVFEKVNANFSGDVVFENVVWTDTAGRKVADLPTLNVSVNLADALKGTLGTGSIEDIVAYKPEFNVEYTDKNGLNVVNLINFPKQGEETPTKFRGVVEIKDAVVNLEMNGQKLNFTKVQMQANMNQYPTMKFNLQGKDEEADLVGDIIKTNGDVSIKAEVKKYKIQTLMKLLPTIGRVKIANGIVPTLVLSAIEKDKKWTVDIKADIAEVAGVFDSYNFSNGKGKFAVDNKAISLSTFTTSLEGQPIEMNGLILFTKEGLPTFDLDFATDSFRVDAISPGLDIADTVSAKGKVTGKIDKPVVKGDFTMARLDFAPLSMTDIYGKYLYQNGLISINDATGKAHSGSFRVVGDIVTETKYFSLNMVANDLDSSAVTETQIKGPLSFNIDMTGTGEAGSAIAYGTFAIGQGNFYNIPFNEITGIVRRTSGNMTFSDINVVTFAGTFATNATINSNGKVTFDKFDNVAYNYSFEEKPEEEIKQQVADSVKKEFDNFFRK